MSGLPQLKLNFSSSKTNLVHEFPQEMPNNLYFESQEIRKY